jgi:hypothetical protein
MGLGQSGKRKHKNDKLGKQESRKRQGIFNREICEIREKNGGFEQKWRGLGGNYEV